MQGNRNSRDPGQLSLTSLLRRCGFAPALAKLSGLTGLNRLVQDSGAGLRSLLARCWQVRHTPAIIPLRPIAGDLDSLARADATAPGGRDAVTDPAKSCSGVAGGQSGLDGWHGGMLPGPNPTHFVDNPTDIYSGRLGHPRDPSLE